MSTATGVTRPDDGTNDPAPDLAGAIREFERLAAWVARIEPQPELPQAFLDRLETDATLREAWKAGKKSAAQAAATEVETTWTSTRGTTRLSRTGPLPPLEHPGSSLTEQLDLVLARYDQAQVYQDNRQLLVTPAQAASPTAPTKRKAGRPHDQDRQYVIEKLQLLITASGGKLTIPELNAYVREFAKERGRAPSKDVVGRLRREAVARYDNAKMQ